MRNVNALVLMVMSFCCMANDSNQPVIPIEIDEVISTSWPEGGGFFRAIVSNSEINPCIVIESLSLLEGKRIAFAQLCPTDIQIADYYFEGKDLVITDDYAGFYEEGTYFRDDSLIVRFEVFLNRGPSFLGHCKIPLAPATIGVAQCEKGSTEQ